MPDRVSGTWTRTDTLALAGAFAIGILIRIVLLPTTGLRDDTDQFAGWVHTIATGGFATLYGPNPFGMVSFGPVMAYIWAALAAIAPGFATVTDAADTSLRILLKTPASVADLGLAVVAVYALRGRPSWAVVAAAAILLQPATWYVSAWWGQYESIYVLPALVAAVAAARGRNVVAAVLLVVSLLAKPQAIAFIVPFAAWFWVTGWRREGVRGGVLELTRTAAAGLVTAVVLWWPFLGAGGPLAYLDNLGHYQNDIFHVLSLRAWNVWWLLQEAAAGGRFIADDVPFIGPLTLRHIGYAVTALFEVVIASAVLRDARPRTLLLALAASTLVFFTFMTQMHERYAYAAVVFLMLLLPDPLTRLLAAALAVVVALDLVAAVPPSPEIGALLPISGVLGVVGSAAIVAITLTIVTALWRETRVTGIREATP